MEREKPIRIAHIIGKWVGGGVEAVVMNYYRNINHDKIQFDFICDSDSTNIPYEEIEKLGGKVILVPPYQHIIAYQKRLKEVFLEGKYKIVHSHINALSVFPLHAAKKAGIPVRIAHSHSTTNKKEWKKNLLKQILRPFSKVYATDYMCCSELAGRWLFGDKTYDQGKVYLLNNAIDLEKFAYNEKIRKLKRKELKIDDKTLVIGHIGRFVAQKNHTFLVDIFNELHKKEKNSILILAGQGPLMEEVKAKVNNLGLTDSVKFLGQRTDANELYQAFDVFLLPSLYEGLGMVAVEAQCAGNYCICSTEVPSIVKMTENIEFLSLHDNGEVWANKILEERCNHNRYDRQEELRQAGYDIEKESRELVKKYLQYYIKKSGNMAKETIAIVTTGYMPIPATRGGAVENLIENILNKNEEKKIYNIVIFSASDKEAEKKSTNYEVSKFIYIKPNFLIRRLDSITYLIAKKIFKKNQAATYKYIFQRLYFLNKVAKKLHISNEYDKVILENHPTLFKCLKKYKNYEKYQNRYYYHLHNTMINDFGYSKYIRESKANICVSKYIANQLAAYIQTTDKSNFKILKNCIDYDKFSRSSYDNKSVKEEYNINIKDKVIIFTGRLTKEKGVYELIQAIKKVRYPNIKVLIVGSLFYKENVKDKFAENLKKEVTVLNDKVIFTGYIDYEKINKIYSIGDIAVLPSIWEEPAGLTILESLASGLPVITTDSGGIPEYVNDDCAFIIKRNKNLIDELASKIDLLLEDDNLRRNMSNEAKKYARQYNLDNYYKNFTEIINN